jgi:Family of unknown function (DUF6498)
MAMEARRLFVPPKAGDAAPSAALDGSIWLLLAVNVATLAVAYWQQWPLTQLMLLYWVQSIAIGVSYVMRIQALEKFSTEGFEIDGQQAQPTPETKAQVVFGIVVPFGFVHALYLGLLYMGAKVLAKTPLRFDLWLLACVLAFALNHYWSYRYNRELDRQGTPNIHALMGIPYVRVVPMHLMLVTGAFASHLVLVWGVVKILADVAMHIVEHRQLQKARKVEA